MRWICAALGFIVFLVGGWFAISSHFAWLLLSVIGIAVGAVGLIYHAQVMLHWRKTLTSKEERREEIERERNALEQGLAALLERLGCTEEDLPALLESARSNMLTARTISRDIERVAQQKDELVGSLHEADATPARLARTWGCADPDALDELLTRATALRQEMDLATMRLRDVVDEAEEDPEARATALREKCEQMTKERQVLAARLKSLADEESELLRGLKSASLKEAEEKLRELRRVRRQIESETTALDHALLGNSLDQMKDQSEDLSKKVARNGLLLESDFGDFAPTIEQVDGWKLELERCDRAIDSINGEMKQIAGRLQAAVESGGSSAAVLRGELEYTRAEIERHELAFRAAMLAIDVLSEMDASPTHLPDLEEAASRHFAVVTNGRYRNLSISPQWDGIEVEHGEGHTIAPRQLSAGAMDQLYFAFRMAAGETLSRRERLPLILDDPFVNFDRERLERALETLLSLARDGSQVLYFTLDDAIAGRAASWRQDGVDARVTVLER